MPPDRDANCIQPRQLEIYPTAEIVMIMNAPLVPSPHLLNPTLTTTDRRLISNNRLLSHGSRVNAAIVGN